MSPLQRVPSASNAMMASVGPCSASRATTSSLETTEAQPGISAARGGGHGSSCHNRAMRGIWQEDATRHHRRRPRQPARAPDRRDPEDARARHGPPDARLDPRGARRGRILAQGRGLHLRLPRRGHPRALPGVHVRREPRLGEQQHPALARSARASTSKDGFVSTYADIVYRGRRREGLVASPHDKVLGCDTDWRRRYVDRTKHPETDAEKLRAEGERVVELSRNIASEDAAGEFIGVTKFTPDGARELIEAFDAAPKKQFAGRVFREERTFETRLPHRSVPRHDREGLGVPSRRHARRLHGDRYARGSRARRQLVGRRIAVKRDAQLFSDDRGRLDASPGVSEGAVRRLPRRARSATRSASASSTRRYRTPSRCKRRPASTSSATASGGASRTSVSSPTSPAAFRAASPAPARDGKYWHTVTGRGRAATPGAPRRRRAIRDRSHARRPIKVALPSPYLLSVRMWDEELSQGCLPDARGIRRRAGADPAQRGASRSRDAGVHTVQLDDPHLCLFVDPAVRAQLRRSRRRGACTACDLINRVFDGVTGVTTAVHLCRRNKGRKGWIGEGSYDAIMEPLCAARRSTS